MCKLHSRVLCVCLSLGIIPIVQQLHPPILPLHRLPDRGNAHELTLTSEELIGLQDSRGRLHRHGLRLFFKNIRRRCGPLESHKVLLAIGTEAARRHLHQAAIRRDRHGSTLPDKDSILREHPTDLSRHRRDDRHQLDIRESIRLRFGLRLFLTRVRGDSIFRQFAVNSIR